MEAARRLPPPPDPERIDHRVRLHGMSWQAYEALLAWRGESSRPRITYLEGEIELMVPSREHETLKKRLARLVEAWAEETGVALEGVGSWTIRDESVERGAEPDECYVLGDLALASAPDIAIEVVWTHGGIDKLEVYRRLHVREVWFWAGGALTFYLLRGNRYARAVKSALLPRFDPSVVVPFMTAPSTQPEAVKALRRALRARKPRKRAR